MDKKIERVFDINKIDENTNVLSMYSRVEGEFGAIVCTCNCELNGSLMAARVEDSGEPDGGFAFRLHELQYFVSFILPLFNPLNSISHEVSQSPAPEPQNP